MHHVPQVQVTEAALKSLQQKHAHAGASKQHPDQASRSSPDSRHPGRRQAAQQPAAAATGPSSAAYAVPGDGSAMVVTTSDLDQLAATMLRWQLGHGMADSGAELSQDTAAPKLLRFDPALGRNGAFYFVNQEDLAADLDQLSDTLSEVDSELTAGSLGSELQAATAGVVQQGAAEWLGSQHAAWQDAASQQVQRQQVYNEQGTLIGPGGSEGEPDSRQRPAAPVVVRHRAGPAAAAAPAHGLLASAAGQPAAPAPAAAAVTHGPAGSTGSGQQQAGMSAAAPAALAQHAPVQYDADSQALLTEELDIAASAAAGRAWLANHASQASLASPERSLDLSATRELSPAAAESAPEPAPAHMAPVPAQPRAGEQASSWSQQQQQQPSSSNVAAAPAAAHALAGPPAGVAQLPAPPQVHTQVGQLARGSSEAAAQTPTEAQLLQLARQLHSLAMGSIRGSGEGPDASAATAAGPAHSSEPSSSFAAGEWLSQQQKQQPATTIQHHPAPGKAQPWQQEGWQQAGSSRAPHAYTASPGSPAAPSHPCSSPAPAQPSSALQRFDASLMDILMEVEQLEQHAEQQHRQYQQRSHQHSEPGLQQAGGQLSAWGSRSSSVSAGHGRSSRQCGSAGQLQAGAAQQQPGAYKALPQQGASSSASHVPAGGSAHVQRWLQTQLYEETDIIAMIMEQERAAG